MFTRDEIKFLEEGLEMRLARDRTFGLNPEKESAQETYERILDKLYNRPQSVALIYYDGYKRDAYLIGDIRLIEVEPDALYWMSEFDNLITELKALLPNDGVQEVIERLQDERAARLKRDTHPRGFLYTGGGKDA